MRASTNSDGNQNWGRSFVRVTWTYCESVTHRGNEPPSPENSKERIIATAYQITSASGKTRIDNWWIAMPLTVISTLPIHDPLFQASGSRIANDGLLIVISLLYYYSRVGVIVFHMSKAIALLIWLRRHSYCVPSFVFPDYAKCHCPVVVNTRIESLSWITNGTLAKLVTFFSYLKVLRYISNSFQFWLRLFLYAESIPRLRISSQHALHQILSG